jgi:PAS domain S-box-containing protein
LAELPSFHEAAVALSLGLPYQIHVSADRSVRRFVQLGSNCEAVTGVRASAALADPSLLYDQILPEHRPRFGAAEEAALTSREPFSMEAQIRRADGQVRWVRIASYPNGQADGSTVWDGLLTDITDTKLLSEALARHRRRLELAVEATGLGLWEWNVRSGAVTWSERNRDLFGVPTDIPISIQTYLAQVHPDDVAAVRAMYEAAAGDGADQDFSIEHRIVTTAGQIRWILVHGRVLRDEAGPVTVVGTNLDVTDRRTAEEQRKLMMAELAHRSKNGMLVMLAMVHQAAEAADTVKAMEEVLTARIHAMAASQDLLTASGGRAVVLGDLFDQLLPVFDLARFDIAPDARSLTMPGETAVGVALLLHELGTNAVKYGALSAGGRVEIRREPSEAGAAIEWRESGGPPVSPPARRGFGTRLLDAALRDRGGRVESHFAPEGFRALIEFRVGA